MRDAKKLGSPKKGNPKGKNSPLKVNQKMNNFLQPAEIDAFVPIEKKEYEEMEEVSLNDLVRAFSGI